MPSFFYCGILSNLNRPGGGAQDQQTASRGLLFPLRIRAEAVVICNQSIDRSSRGHLGTFLLLTGGRSIVTRLAAFLRARVLTYNVCLFRWVFLLEMC